MKIAYEDLDPGRFSFCEDPLLIIEGFWNEAEMERFRRAMGSAQWTTLAAMPKVSAQFPRCGDWAKAEIAEAERAHLTSRVFGKTSRDIDASEAIWRFFAPRTR